MVAKLIQITWLRFGLFWRGYIEIRVFLDIRQLFNDIHDVKVKAEVRHIDTDDALQLSG